MFQPKPCPAVFVGALLAALAVLCPGGAPAAERVVEIPTRPGVTMKLIEIAAKDRSAPIVILFAGGNGKVRLDDWDGSGTPTRNFLVRSRGLFADQGFHVAVPDAPSDRKEMRRGLIRFRTTGRHARDIAAVIRHMRKLSSGPVVLIGTSRGSISAANGAARLPKGEVAAVVLSATVTRPNNRGNRDQVQDADLAAITVPVLFSHHKEDECYVTVPDDLPDLAKEFRGAPEVKIQLYDGGGPFRGNPCRARAAHGFVGIEDEVVAGTARWIRQVIGTTQAR
jgi:pimeloyl-ACP methyl ester carboxylesterase